MVSLAPFELQHVEAICALKEAETSGAGQRWRARFDWQYLDNPEVNETTHRGWVLLEDRHTVRGCVLVMPQRFQVFGELTVVNVCTDLIVAPTCRGHGLSLVFEYFREFRDATLALCTSASDRTQRIWEAQRGAPVPGSQSHYMAILRAAPLLRDKLYRRLGTTASEFVAGPLSICWRLCSRQCSAGLRRGIEVEAVDTSDQRLIEIWEASRAAYPITAIRDAQFLRWRHGTGGSHLLLVSHEGTPVCWAAYVSSPRRNARDAKRARILDVFGMLHEPAVCTNAVRALLLHLGDQGYDAADFKGLHPVWQNALSAVGCRPVEIPACFVYRSSPDLHGDSQTAANWHIVPADGDCGFWDIPAFPPHKTRPQLTPPRSYLSSH